MESMQIHLNSKFANNYINGSSSNCDFYLPIIEVPPQHQIYLSIVNAQIPYSFYNVDSTNNTIQHTINNITYYLDIPAGNYNVNNLKTYLEQNMVGNFTISFDPITNKFTFNCAVSNFKIEQASTCLELLGFKSTDATIYLTSITQSLTSRWCINLLSKHCICIQINQDTGSINYSKQLSNNILASIPVLGQPYSMINYNNTNNHKINLYTNTLSYLNIKIIDQNNNILNLNGCNWTLTLQLDVIKFVD